MTGREIELRRYQKNLKKRISKELDRIQTEENSSGRSSQEKDDLLATVFSFIESQP